MTSWHVISRDLSSARWRKSSRSGTTGGECVEVAALDPAVAVRDSKDPDGPELVLVAGDWRTLITGIKQGR
ncbi:DUF397 domain-containing protein [Spirillospora sp. NPDC048819]|uniref:DUF397 domain-containing protein n=1 Tax=Spirillospora sp. NPDC048819 TaxID=3155268 RepID=UPI0033FC00B4